MSNDWLYMRGSVQWTISTDSSSSNGVFAVDNNGMVTTYGSYARYVVRPVFFLKSDVEIKEGIGSKSSPFLVKISE